jgi:hypothetical protein
VTDGNAAAAIRLMLTAMALRSRRARRKETGRAPSGRPSRGIDVSTSRQRVAPGDGPKAARVPLSQNVPFASEVLAGRMPERGKSGY